MGVLSGSKAEREQRPLAEGDQSLDRQRLWRTKRVADLSSGIAHEVRNPLNAMAIHVEVLSDKLRAEAGDSIPAHLQPNLTAIRRQIRRLDEIVRCFADFAQGRSQHRSLEGMLDAAMALCAFPLRRRGLDVSWGRIPDVQLSGDPASLSLGVVELLLLGIAAAKEGSQIRIDMDTREVPGHVVEVRFALEAPLARVDADRLAMVRELVEDQGGSLERSEGCYAILSLRLDGPEGSLRSS